MISPTERRLNGRIGALTVHAKGLTNTGPARAAFAARFYDGIPEDLPQAERDRRAGFARRAYFTRLALASSRARSGRRLAPALVIAARQEGEAAKKEAAPEVSTDAANAEGQANAHAAT